MGGEHFLKLLRVTEEAIKIVDIGQLADEFVQHNIAEGLSLETVKTRRSHLKQFAEFCNRIGVSDITLLNNLFIDEYSAEYSKDHKKSTTNTHRRVLRAFLLWVKQYKEVNIRAVPEQVRVRRDKNRDYKFIERSIIQKVIDECPHDQDRLIIATFAETGVRVSEITKIKVKDIRRGEEIRIHGKGEKDRTVPITPELATAMGQFIRAKGRSADEYLFQNKRKGFAPKLTTDTVRRLVTKHFIEIADTKMTPHWLRHSFAIMLLLSGCDIVTIQKILGHEDVNTTMVYLNITDPQKNASYRAHIGKSFVL